MSDEPEATGPPAVVLQHRDDAPGGVLMDILAAQGFRPTTVRVDLGEPLPDPAGCRLAVTLGTDGILERLASGTAIPELDWLRTADRAGTALLGLGSGAQALAVALGGTVTRAPRPRHGWVWVSSSTPAWIAPGPWLAWGEVVIRLPATARLLAHDGYGPQVFGWGRHLGVQFHPEVTREMVGHWVTGARDGRFDAQGILETTSREFAGASAAAHTLLATYLHPLAVDPA